MNSRGEHSTVTLALLDRCADMISGEVVSTCPYDCRTKGAEAGAAL